MQIFKSKRNLLTALIIAIPIIIFLLPERVTVKERSNLCTPEESCLYELGAKVFSLAYSNDGTYLYGGGLRWDTAQYKTTRLRTSNLALSADGRYALSDKDEVKIFDAEGEELLEFSTLEEGLNSPRNAVFAEAVDALAIPHYDRKTEETSLTFWSTRHGGFITELPHDASIVSLVSSGQDLLAAGQFNGKIVLWPTNDFTNFKIIEASSESIKELSLDSSGAVLASADKAGNITVWNTTTAEQLLNLNEGDDITGMNLSNDAKMLVVAYRSGKVLIWNTDSGELLSSLSYPEKISTIALSPDQKQLAVSLWERTETRTRRVKIESPVQDRWENQEYEAVVSPAVILIRDISELTKS